jgi:hypothetical protein
VIAMGALVQKILARVSGNRTSRTAYSTGLEPLSSSGPAQYGGMRGSRDGRFSPEQDVYGQNQTSYAAGYHAPPMPPQTARDPSPGAMQGRTQTFRADELRPDGYGYGNRSRAGSYGDGGPENMPLREGRDMV